MLRNLPGLPTSDQKLRLQQLFMQLVGTHDAKNPTDVAFPGAQPVSFERRHLADPAQPSFATMPFYAAEKTDGVRYMLFIAAGETYAVDRNFELKKLPKMHFPKRGGGLLDKTILDGELVLDAPKPKGAATASSAADATAVAAATDAGADDPSPAAKRPKHADAAAASSAASAASPTAAPRMVMRYLAYDVCVIDGENIMAQPLPPRLMRMRRDVLGPRYAAAAAGHDFSAELFRLEAKDFFSTEQLPHIFRHVAPAGDGAEWLYGYADPLRALEHGNDGIIFTPIMEPYVTGTCRTLLKWKPADMNSIDFQLQTVWRRGEPRFRLLMAQNGMLYDDPMDWITFSAEQQARFAKDRLAEQRVVECVWDPQWVTEAYDSDGDNWDAPTMRVGGWRFERVREDKNLPNDIKTVLSVQRSARDGVRKEELLNAIAARRR